MRALQMFMRRILLPCCLPFSHNINFQIFWRVPVHVEHARTEAQQVCALSRVLQKLKYKLYIQPCVYYNSYETNCCVNHTSFVYLISVYPNKYSRMCDRN